MTKANARLLAGGLFVAALIAGGGEQIMVAGGLIVLSFVVMAMTKDETED